MKRFNQLLFASLIFLPLFFSCNKKSNDSGGKNSSQLRTDSSIVDSAAIKAEEEQNKHATEWSVNEQSSKVNFTIKNFGQDVHGSLGGLKATIHFDEKKLKSSGFEASAKVNTINTGNDKRDKDLMHPKYFDEANFHEITFRSDTVIKSGNAYKTIGKLTIKGKAIQREIPFTFEQKGNSGIFKSQFSFERLDYDIGGSGPIMGKEVNVSLEIVTEQQ